MTPIQIARAYNALMTTNMTGIPMAYHDARALALLKRALSEEFQIAAQAEKDMLARNNGKMNQDGSFEFVSDADREAFQREYDSFRGTDEQIALPCLDLSAYADRILISTDALEALSGVVVFERDEPETQEAK